MRLTERFRRLTPWNKLGVIGAAASVIGLPVALLLYFLARAPDSASLRANTDLKLIELAVIDDDQIDLKLKNSGADSAFITGITFIFAPASSMGTICNPVTGAVYDYQLIVEHDDESLRLAPRFEELSSVVERLWENKKPAQSEADGSPTPHPRPDDKSLTEIVELSRGIGMGTTIHSTFATAPTQRLPVSQAVPPRGVDRVRIRFTMPLESFSENAKAYFVMCRVVYWMTARAILQYDAQRELVTPDFQLHFNLQEAVLHEARRSGEMSPPVAAAVERLRSLLEDSYQVVE